MNHSTNLSPLAELDPMIDCAQIYHRTIGYEFPWEMTRALEIALMRTFCIPNIARLLDRTGEFYHRPQKRYDDTGIIFAEIAKWGYDSERGKQAISRMNAIHARFQISNADFLYVLSTFIYEPIRWNAKFGWRLMTESERLAAFYFWREVGAQMNIQNIPATYHELELYNQEYEVNNFHYTDANHRLAIATRDLFLSWFPRLTHPVLTPGINAVLDDWMLDALGLDRPAPWLRSLGINMLKLRSRLMRLLPPRSQPDFFIDSSIRSYPQGYHLDRVGASGRDSE